MFHCNLHVLRYDVLHMLKAFMSASELKNVRAIGQLRTAKSPTWNAMRDEVETHEEELQNLGRLMFRCAAMKFNTCHRNAVCSKIVDDFGAVSTRFLTVHLACALSRCSLEHQVKVEALRVCEGKIVPGVNHWCHLHARRSQANTCTGRDEVVPTCTT